MSQDLEIKLANVEESIEMICDQLTYYTDLETDILEESGGSCKVDRYLLKRAQDIIRNLQKDLKNYQKIQHELMTRLNL